MSRLCAGAIGVVLAACGQAWAATCTVSATGVAFGGYDYRSPAPLESTGSVTVDCTGGVEIVNYGITLSTGSSGSFAARTLSSGINTLQYNLYTDAGRLTVWGDGAGGTSTVGGSLVLVGGAASASHTVYGRAPAGQNVRAGSYSDSVTVTVTY